jgi:hypothetical protein
MENSIFAMLGIESMRSASLEAPSALVFANVQRVSKGL